MVMMYSKVLMVVSIMQGECKQGTFSVLVEFRFGEPAT